jgi:hypothetical protein
MQIASKRNMKNISAQVKGTATGTEAIAAGATLKIMLRGAKVYQKPYSEILRDERVGKRKEQPSVFK